VLRATLFQAADTARRQDPQLARVYYQQMTERGATHLKACCVVAGHLVRDPFGIFGSQTGATAVGNGWGCLVSGYADLARFLLRILFMAVPPAGKRGPDLVPVDGLGDRRASVAHQVTDVLDADAPDGQGGHEGLA
jgi:hypothetical protein